MAMRMKPNHRAKKQRARELLTSGLSQMKAAAQLQTEFGIGEKADWALVFNPESLEPRATEPTPPTFLQDWLRET